MKKYSVQKVSDTDFRVIEVHTGFVLRKLEDQKTARSVANGLNGGKGFNGDTPPFFLNLEEQLV